MYLLPSTSADLSFCLFGALALYPEGASPQFCSGMVKVGNVGMWPGGVDWPRSVQHTGPYSGMETYLVWLSMRNFDPITACDCSSAMPKWYIPFYFSRFDLRNPLFKNI